MQLYKSNASINPLQLLQRNNCVVCLYVAVDKLDAIDHFHNDAVPHTIDNDDSDDAQEPHEERMGLCVCATNPTEIISSKIDELDLLQ